MELETAPRKVRYIVHVSDIHIRTGDLVKCRYAEYSEVFDNFVNDVSRLENLEETVLVITGDIFHNKGKIEPSGIKLAQSLLMSLLAHVDVIMICGNHDYRQDNPSIPDMIESIYDNYINQTVKTKHRAYYLNKTGYYLYNNVCFTVVDIKDTLKDYNTFGKNEAVLDFLPKISFPNIDYTIALFHGTILSSRLANNLQITDAYTIDWFANHDYIMLGDNHRMQWSNDDGRLWAYSGSLIQQDFGEYFMEHGYLIWNLESKTISSRKIFNDYGFCTVKDVNGTLMVHMKQKIWNPIDTFEKFPTHISFRTLLKDDLQKVHSYCAKNNLKPTCILQWTTSVCDENELLNNTHIADIQHIEELNTISKWFEYLEKHTDINEIRQFIINPELLKLPQVQDGIAEFLKKYTTRNDKIQKVIDEYVCETTKIHKNIQRVELVNMQWAYLMCYGESNHFDFKKLNNTIALLNGKNAMGKSSFLDVVCIALYGEPTKMRNIVNGRKYTDKIIHDQRPMNKTAPSVRLMFKIGDQHYEIYRSFGSQAGKNKDHLIMQTCVQIYECGIDDKKLYLEGSTLVERWISENIGNMDTVLMATMICQTDLNNFFHLKQDEQKSILDKALRLDTVALYGKILKESILAHNDMLQQSKTAKQTMESMIPKDMSEHKIHVDKAISELDTEIAKKQEWKAIILGHNTRIIKESNIPDNIDVLFSEAETLHIAQHTDNVNVNVIETEIVYREKLIAIEKELEQVKHVITLENDETNYKKWKDKYEVFLSKKPQYDSTKTYKIPPISEDRPRPSCSVDEYEERLLNFNKISKPTFPYIHVNTSLTEYQNSVSKLVQNPIQKNRTQEEYDEWKSTNESQSENDINIVKVKKRLHMYEEKVSNAKQAIDIGCFEFNKECISCNKNHKQCVGTKPALLQKWKNIIKECNELINTYDLYEKYKIEKTYWDAIIVNWKEYDEWKSNIEYHSKIIREYEQSEAWLHYNEGENIHLKLVEDYKLAKYYVEKDEWDKYKSSYELYEIWSKEHEIVLGKLKAYGDSVKKRNLEKSREIIYSEYMKNKNLATIHRDYEKYKDMFYSIKLHIVDRELRNLNNEREELIVENAKLEESIILFKKHSSEYEKIIQLERLYEERLLKIKELEFLFIGDKVTSDGYKEWIYKTQVIPLINNEMNTFLQMFENITFDMSYIKKHFIYMIEDRGNKPTLDKASGYQNFIIGLAFRIILTRIGAVGQQLKHLFIDEGFTSCDSTNIEKVPQLLKSILKYGDYSGILMMSHLDSVRGCTNIHINIDRNDPFSYIRFGEQYKK